MQKIILIGCGHMGHALLNSMLNKKNLISIVDPKSYADLKKKIKNKKINIYKSLENISDLSTYDFIIFAVRPSELRSVFKELTNFSIKANAIVISVIAGKKIAIFKNNIPKVKKIVRVMPNMPALIGQGMNCMASNKFISKKDKREIESLFEKSGIVIWLRNENEIDMATAVSGSGPGFVFNIVDAMINSAKKLGFTNNVSKTLVYQTFKGSLDLLVQSKLEAYELVEKVATKGGTTEAGLKVMKQKKIHNIFSNVIKSSYERAKKQGLLK